MNKNQGSTVEKCVCLSIDMWDCKYLNNVWDCKYPNDVSWRFADIGRFEVRWLMQHLWILIFTRGFVYVDSPVMRCAALWKIWARGRLCPWVSTPLRTYKKDGLKAAYVPGLVHRSERIKIWAKSRLCPWVTPHRTLKNRHYVCSPPTIYPNACMHTRHDTMKYKHDRTCL